MSDDLDVAQAIANYLAAKRRFSDAEAVVDAVHKRLVSAASAIQNAESSLKNNLGRRERSFNPANDNLAIKDIPDSAEVLGVMSSWVEARNLARAAYLDIPAADRGEVAKPPAVLFPPEHR